MQNLPIQSIVTVSKIFNEKDSTISALIEVIVGCTDLKHLSKGNLNRAKVLSKKLQKSKIFNNEALEILSKAQKDCIQEITKH